MGAPGESGTFGSAGAGGLHVIFGRDSDGLSADGNVRLNQGAALDDLGEPSDQLGACLGADDFNGDGFSDLVAGVPNENGTGALHVLYGSAGAFDATSSEQFFTQTGLGDPAEPGDGFASRGRDRGCLAGRGRRSPRARVG